MSVDLEGRQLRYFAVLAEELNFTRAARRVHVAQQTLSDSMQQLERIVGVRLLDRSPRSVTLTPAGVVFREHAIALLAAGDRAVEAALAAQRAGVNHLLVGSPDWPAGIELFRSAIVALESASPDVTVEVAPTAWVRHLAELDAGRLDIGVTFASGPLDLPEELTAVSIGRERANLFLVAADHPLVGIDAVRCEHLRDVPLLLIRRRDHERLHDHLVDGLVQRGIHPLVHDGYGESFSTAVAHAMLHRSAIWVVPSMTTALPAGLAVVEVEDLDVEVDLLAVWRRDHTRPAIEMFIDALSTAAGSDQ